MTDEIEVIKIKQARGRLLTNLNLFYPTPVTVATLYRTVCDDPAYNKTLLLKDLTYFHQKGYIEYVDEAVGGSDEFEKKVCRLTDTGKEVAEGTRKDPALEV
jgi:hypothetical protein